ncbi:MAG TPA: hypothetical protein VHR88_01435 [Solirubrobacteraceae bacterium]|jgi:hypothetical protein|nr:hypothetical protein [Solirubrobacteraceae bacterium]
MEAALPLRPPSVRTAGDRVAVDGLVVDDPVAVRLVREREEARDDAARLLLDAIEIGARVLDREQAGANADFVRTEFEKQAREVEAAFGERATAVGEKLATQLEEVFGPQTGSLSKALERHFSDDSSGSVQQRVRTLVGEVMAQARHDLLQQFSAADGRNPLADFKVASLAMMKQAAEQQDHHLTAMRDRMAALERQLQGLRDEKTAAVQLAAERERGTAKGRTFEDAVFDTVETIAAAQGDCAEPVGDLTSGGGKRGDTVVSVDAATGPARGRVVFEAKDRRISRKKSLEELGAALDQRSAQFAVWVVPSEEELPAGVRDLRELDGDKLFVVFDPEDGARVGLEVAYKLARARVLLTRDEIDGLDPALVAERVELARRAMEDVRRIKSQLTGATTAIGSAREVLDEMAAAVRARLGEIDEAIAEALAREPEQRSLNLR